MLNNSIEQDYVKTVDLHNIVQSRMLYNMIQCIQSLRLDPILSNVILFWYPMLYNTGNSFKSSRPSLDITPVLPTKFDLILNFTSIIPSCSIVTNLPVSMRLRVALSVTLRKHLALWVKWAFTILHVHFVNCIGISNPSWNGSRVI